LLSNRIPIPDVKLSAPDYCARRLAVSRDCADRRSDVRRRDRQHALLDFEQCRIRRLHARAAHHHRADQERNAKILKEIQTGAYAQEFLLENQTSATKLNAMRRIGRQHPIEVVGAKLRDMMPWIKRNKLVDQSKN
jgi:hypothetical protein